MAGFEVILYGRFWVITEGRLVPEGAVIEVDSATFDGDKLVEVIWNGRRAMMFTQDLRSRGVLSEIPITLPRKL